MAQVRVYLEAGTKRVFAGALAWPGWCRSGKGEDDALAALAAYAPRYGRIAKLAKVEFPAEAPAFTVVERLKGSAATDFGAPYEVAKSDRTPMTKAEADRAIALLNAAWRALDLVIARAPAALRKGPRGGGRDRDEVAAHVLDAEVMYARRLGITARMPDADPRAIRSHREAIVAALRRAAPRRTHDPKIWPARYAARRIAWHVLDHAWEIEDRSTLA